MLGGGGGGKVGSAWYDLELRDEGFLGQVQSVGREGAAGLKPLDAAADDVSKKLNEAGDAAEGSGGKFRSFGDVAKGAVMGVGLAVGNLATNMVMQAPAQAMQFLGDSISLAGDKAESASKAATIFGDAYKYVEDASKNAANTVNMSSGAYLAAAGDLGNLTTNLGYTGEEAANMSVDMLQLAADMGSFNNASPEEVVSAMGAAFRGETEPIRRFGVMLDEVAIKNKAVEMGLYAGTGALDKNAKAQATYALILEQTSNAQGDLAKTADSLANTQARAAAQTEEAMTKLGERLVPIATLLTGAFASGVNIAIDAIGGLFDIVTSPGGLATLAILGTIALPAIAAGFATAAAAAWAFVAPLLITAAPVLAVVGAVAAFVLILQELGVLGEIIERLQTLGEIVIPQVKGAFDAIIGVVGEIGARLGGMVGMLMDIGGALIDFADAAIRALNLDFEGAAAAVERGMARMGSAGENALRMVGDEGQKARDAQAALGEQAERTGEQIAAASENLGVNLMNVRTEFELTGDAAATHMGGIPVSLLNASQATEDFSSSSARMAAEVEAQTALAAAAFGHLPARIAEHIQGAKNAGFQVGVDVASGVGRGIAEGSLELGSAMDELKWILENGLTPEQQATQALGEKWVRNFREGMNSEIPGAVEAAQKVGIEALQALSQVSIGGKEAKRIGEIVDELYASGLDENAVIGALAAEGVGVDALRALGRVKGWDTAAINDAIEFAGGLESQGGRVESSARALANNGKDGVLSVPWGEWGIRAGVLFGSGINSPGSAATVRREARALAGIAGRNLRLESPAKEGPLSEGGGPEGWGERFAELFGAGIGHGRGKVAREVAGVGGLLGSLAGGVDVPIRPDVGRWAGAALEDLPGRRRGREGGLHLHIGTLIADDNGIRQLQRRLDQVTRQWERG